MLAPWIALQMAPDQYWVALVAGLLAIFGHSFTCLAGFRGGKGVLTAFGVFCTLNTNAALLSFATWITLTFVSGYVSLGSIGGCLVLAALLLAGFFNLPYIGWIANSQGPVHWSLLATGIAVAVFVIVKHISNIKRLLNGTENGFRKKAPKDGQK
jgi:glycerol-3-phosphate acyltransferase PlsY